MVGANRDWFAAVRWVSPHWVVGRYQREAVGAKGEQYEWTRIVVGEIRNGRLASACQFEMEDEAAAPLRHLFRVWRMFADLPEAIGRRAAKDATTAREEAIAADLPDYDRLQPASVGYHLAFPDDLDRAELFDPATNTFAALPATGNTQLAAARYGAVAAPLPNGKVLIAGGEDPREIVLAFKQGASDCVTKPLDWIYLRKLIRKYAAFAPTA